MPVRKIKDFPNAFSNFREDLFPKGIRVYCSSKAKFVWDDFYKHHGVSLMYLIYRGLYMLYFQVAVIYSIICRASYYYIYVTFWTLILQSIFGTLFFIEVLYHYILEKLMKEDYAEMDHLLPSKLTALEKTIWILFSTVSVVPLIVTIVYWTVVYPRSTNPEFECDIIVNVLAHIGNSVFCLMELLINALPVHITHFVHVVAYAVTYIAFTGIYEVAVGTYPYKMEYIYSILNWKRKPVLALGVAFGMTLFGIIVHLILWTFYIFRLFLVTMILKYDVYSYHEYTYRTKRNTPNLHRSQAEVQQETPANVTNTDVNIPRNGIIMA